MGLWSSKTDLFLPIYFLRRIFRSDFPNDRSVPFHETLRAIEEFLLEYLTYTYAN